jgi:hypothetical protein
LILKLFFILKRIRTDDCPIHLLHACMEGSIIFPRHFVLYHHQVAELLVLLSL